MKLKTIRNLLLVSGAVFATTVASAAEYSFEFLAHDNSYQVEGIFTTADVLNGAGGYSIVGITGTVTGANGGAITSLVNDPVAPNANNQFGYIYDNNYFPSSPLQLNWFGVLFTTGEDTKWNLWGGNQNNTPFTTNYTLHSYTGTGGASVLGGFTTAVPEPESYAMMLAGLALMGTIARRRKSKAA